MPTPKGYVKVHNVPSTRIALVAFDINEGRSARYPPLNLCTLATQLEDAGYEVRVFDFAAPLSTVDGYFREIADFGPGMIGMACFTPHIATFHGVSSGLRKAAPKAAMVIGGYHPTIRPQESLRLMPQFDYAMQGECDYAVCALAGMLEGKNRSQDVPGLVYREGDAIRMNPRDTVPDLNKLPVPRRSFLDRYHRRGMYGYITMGTGLDMMITSRGCPYRCSFCFKVETKYRFRNVESVMAEFDLLRRRGVRHVHIMDDAFTANKKRCHAIADELIRGKYDFWMKVRSRVNSVDEELLRKLKRCGVRQIVYGIESGSQRVLDSMDKHSTVEMNERAIDLTNRAGLFCAGDIMIGMPGETPETIGETIAFLRRNQVIISHVPYLYPLPGTRVYDAAREDGSLQGDWSLDGHVPWIKLAWTDSRQDLENAARQVEKSVHRNPARMLYLLRHNPQLLKPGSLRKRAGALLRLVFN